MRSFTAAFTLVSVCFASLAFADEGEPANHAVAETPQSQPEWRQLETHWYGWQTLTSDGIALGLAAIAAQQSNSAGGYVALGTYLLAPPIIHAAHDQWGRAAGSLALRVGMPITLGFVGCHLQDDHGDGWGCLAGAVLGMAAGAIGASVIDGSALAYERVPKQSFSWQPTASASKDAWTLGIGGTF